MITMGSPFLLQIGGVWCAAEGVQPGVSVAADRARSSITTVGGVRHSQRARRAPRTWTWELPQADAQTLRLLEVAAESTDVMLLDTSSAAVNMLRLADSFGAQANAVGLVQGVPVRMLDSGATFSVTVRSGVPVQVSCWTSATAGATAMSVVRPGGTTTVVAPAGAGLRQATATFTPTANGTAVATVPNALTCAPQVTEGASVPAIWAPGQGTPCRVSVADPARTLQRLTAGVMYAGATVTLEEVG